MAADQCKVSIDDLAELVVAAGSNQAQIVEALGRAHRMGQESGYNAAKSDSERMRNTFILNNVGRIYCQLRAESHAMELHRHFDRADARLMDSAWRIAEELWKTGSR